MPAALLTPASQQYIDGASTLDPQSFGGDWRRNPNYLLTLYNNGSNVPDINRIVQAYLPEQFHFRIESHWEPFLSSLGNIGSLVEKVNELSTVAGYSFNIKYLSNLIWKSTEPMNFSFTLQFDAKTSSLIDVKQPVANLIYMVSPGRGSGILGSNLLNAPGPTLADPSQSISMKIGRFFYCDSVIVDSIDVTWYTAFESSGDPIAADVEIALRVWYTPDRDDILNYFGMGDLNGTNAATANAAESYIKSVPTDYSNNVSPPINAQPNLSEFFKQLPAEALNRFRQGYTGNPGQ